MKTNKVMLCKRPDCPRPGVMTAHEQPDHWLFICPTCQSAQVWEKARPEIGGTRGAGQTANGCRSVVGRGF